MAVQTDERPPSVLAEGKTKIIFPTEPGIARIKSKTDITAGDGAKHDVFDRKDEYATTTTCAVFALLNACGIPTAYRQQLSSNEFEAFLCEMIPYEVVTRRIALGSYLKRNPNVKRASRFEALVVEFYLKTNGKRFGSVVLEKDDPFICSFGPDGVRVVRPDLPVGEGNPSVHIPATDVYGKDNDVGHPFAQIETIARKTFLVLEKAWQQQFCELCDLKIELGFTTDGRLVVADVIDNDSWRLFDKDGEHLDKQRYRDGGSLEVIEGLYRDVAERVGRFKELHARPEIVLWRASGSDDIGPFFDALEKLELPHSMINDFSGSVHKAPEKCLRELREHLQKEPCRDKVIIAYVGRSNGAGPVIQGDTHYPVIAVPASAKEFPGDVWSSLRMPSDLPMMTCLDPANAIQAALGILAAKSPHVYMARRFRLEGFKTHWDNSPTYSKDS
jgi:phosphoribosylaminoimidazole carboxylase/phosphoribosylaminoimidazole-succinocarboxamide synthase